MGTLDRIIRSIIAVVIIVLYFTNVLSATVALILLALALIFLLTSLISVCPLYLPFGITTCKKK
ncbi:MAG: DUF2892 domain-containing protein [Cytophagales bacterium]|nr:MAG: DUF2892 domain-containing protein [Cytophagales bacterium]